jgi:phage tail protein X
MTDRIYVSTQGDWWDLIALRVYGVRRGNEHLMFRLLEANYPLRQISQFPAGVAVVVPETDVATEIPLVPWKSARRGASP